MSQSSSTVVRNEPCYVRVCGRDAEYAFFCPREGCRTQGKRITMCLLCACGLCPECDRQIRNIDVTALSDVSRSSSETQTSTGSQELGARSSDDLLAGNTIASVGPSPSTRNLQAYASEAARIIIVAVEYKRSPASFLRCLLESPTLSQCRSDLQAAGREMEVPGPGGAKLFVRLEHYEPVLRHLETRGVRFDDDTCYVLQDLRPRHVIISDCFESALDAAIASLRSRQQVRQMRRVEVDIPPIDARNVDEQRPGDDDDAELTEIESTSEESATVPLGVAAVLPDRLPEEVKVMRTFIHVTVPVPSSLWSGPSSGQKTKSTTQMHGPNPRKKRKPTEWSACQQPREVDDATSQSQPPSIHSSGRFGMSQDGASLSHGASQSQSQSTPSLGCLSLGSSQSQW